VSAVLADEGERALIVPLSEVADLVRGVSYPKADAREEPSPGFVPVLRATNIQEGKLILDSDLVFVAERNVSADQLLRPGDIVVATSSGSKHLVGKSGQLQAAWQGAFGAFCATIRPRPGVHPRYLALFLQAPAYWRQITQKALGVNINNLRRGDLESLELPLPPLAVQASIVAELEKQFSRLDEAVANLKRVKANLARFRASVYQAAVEGALLVEPSRADGGSRAWAESAEALLTRASEIRRTTWKGRGKYRAPENPPIDSLPPIPAGWVWATWGQVGHSQNGRAFPSSEYIDGGLRLLRPGNLHQAGEVVWDEGNTRHLPETYATSDADLIVEGGELVMNLTAQSLKDEFLGRVCLTRAGERCLLNQRLARLTPCGFSARYALVVFKSRWFRAFVDKLNTGSLIQHMFTSQLERFPFPLPPLEEQDRIIAEVDRRLSIVREVEAEVDADLKRTKALRSAVLGSGFQAQ
jgi:type I restriction enzyme S subunit